MVHCRGFRLWVEAVVLCPLIAGKDCQTYDVIISSKFFDVIQVSSRLPNSALYISSVYHLTPLLLVVEETCHEEFLAYTCH